jgi:hypothetical protein
MVSFSLPGLLQVSTSMMDPPGLRNHLLMLADTESEKTKWVVALNELHRILKRNKLPNRAVFKPKEVMDNSITLIKTAGSGAVIDTDRLAIGTEEGLLCIDLDREGGANSFATFQSDCFFFPFLLIPFLFSLSWNRNRSGGREQTHLPN